MNNILILFQSTSIIDGSGALLLCGTLPSMMNNSRNSNTRNSFLSNTKSSPIPQPIDVSNVQYDQHDDYFDDNENKMMTTYQTIGQAVVVGPPAHVKSIARVLNQHGQAPNHCYPNRQHSCSNEIVIILFAQMKKHVKFFIN